MVERVDVVWPAKRELEKTSFKKIPQKRLWQSGKSHPFSFTRRIFSLPLCWRGCQVRDALLHGDDQRQELQCQSVFVNTMTTVD